MANRISQLGTEVATAGEQANRISQLGVEVMTPNSASAQRYSQLGVEVMTPWRARTLTIRAEYSGAGQFRPVTGEGTMTIEH